MRKDKKIVSKEENKVKNSAKLRDRNKKELPKGVLTILPARQSASTSHESCCSCCG